VPASKETSPLGDALLNLNTDIMEKEMDILERYPVYRMSFDIEWELEEAPDGELLTCLLRAWMCEKDENPNFIRFQDGTTYRSYPTISEDGRDTTVEKKVSE
jgi:hypothetical protein